MNCLKKTESTLICLIYKHNPFNSFISGVRRFIPRLLIINILILLLFSCSFPLSPTVNNQAVGLYAPCLHTPYNYSSEDSEWLRNHLIPFDISTLSGSGLGNNEFSSRDIIGIGESSHGSHELTEIQIEFTKYLIKHFRYQIVAFEIPNPYVYKINAFINGEDGDLKDLLRQMNSWVFYTEEFFNFLVWLKEYNALSNHKVILAGYDISINDAQSEINVFNNYLGVVEPKSQDKFRQQLTCINMDPFLYSQNSVVDKEECRATINNMISSLEMNRLIYIKESSTEQFELALKSLQSLLQLEELYSSSINVNYRMRDQFMKENVIWIIETLGQNEKKAILWGHNTHIGRNVYGEMKFGTMGFLLDQQYGNKYSPIGSTFYNGEFNAIPLTSSHESDIPPADSYEAFFTSANVPLFFIQLDQISTPNWFTEEHCLRSVGASYDDTKPGDGWDVDELSKEFDGFFFVTKSTPNFLY